MSYSPIHAWPSSPLKAGNNFSRKQSGRSLSTTADDSFEVIGDDSICWNDSSKPEDFEIDLDLEEQAIRQYNLSRIAMPNFNLLSIGKSNRELSFLEGLSAYTDLKDLYSAQDKNEILVVTGKLNITQGVTSAF
jgi:hypothetical protein